ncbi:terminase large subunit, partial [Enterococcus faecium]
MNQFLSYNHLENWFKAIQEGTIKVCKDQLLLKKYLEERDFTREDINFDKQMVQDSINIP